MEPEGRWKDEEGDAPPPLIIAGATAANVRGGVAGVEYDSFL